MLITKQLHEPNINGTYYIKSFTLISIYMILLHISGVTHPHTLKMKTTKEEGVGVCSLVHNILRVKGRVGVPGWGLGRVTSGSIIQANLYKPNNKLVSA
jgi:hypothetical protein